MLGHAVTNNCSESMLEVQRRKNSEQAWNQFVQFYIMLGWRTSHMSYGPKALFEEGIAMGTYGFSILLSHCMTLLLKEKAWTVIV